MHGYRKKEAVQQHLWNWRVDRTGIANKDDPIRDVCLACPVQMLLSSEQY